MDKITEMGNKGGKTLGQTRILIKNHPEWMKWLQEMREIKKREKICFS